MDSDRVISAWGAWVDYVRMTLPSGEVNQEAREAYHRAVMSAGRASSGVEIRARPWALLGYYGTQIGQAAWGESGQGLIIQASGGAASNLFRQSVPYANVTRLDLQVTVWYKEYYPDVARLAAEQAYSARDKRPRRAVKMRYIDGYGLGDTLYVGRRGADSRFLRIYDKWRESGESEEYLHSWRYEVELTDRYALVAYRELQGLGETDATVAGMVSSEFARRGLSLPVLVEKLEVPVSSRKRRMPDTDRRMRWLREQVAPSLERLLADGVSRDDIFSALGLH